MLNSTATQKPLTSNPFITDEANKINEALITKVNRPSVRIFIGKVRIIKIGFRIIFITPKNTASHKAAHIPLTATPEII